MRLSFDDVNAMLEPLLLSAHAGLYLVDLDRRITDWNKGAELLTGFAAEEVLGKDCADVCNVCDRDGNSLCQGRCPMHKAFAEGSFVDCTEPGVYFVAKDGTKVPMHAVISPILSEAGEVVGGMKFFLETSAYEDLYVELEAQARRDELTGLPNRRAFEEELRRQCPRSDRYASPLSMLFIDVDDFKDYNDRYGHPEGDKVLYELANVLRQNLRKVDLPYRFGGEEFVVLLPETPADRGLGVAERIREIFAGKEFRPCGENGKPVTVHKTISIGVADYAPGMQPEGFVRVADDAMYKAKGEGKNRVCLGA